MGPAHGESPRGYHRIDKDLWLVFSLPEYFSSERISSYEYGDPKGGVSFTVHTLLEHPGLEAVAQLNLIAVSQESKSNPYLFHNALVASRGALNEWASLARSGVSYDLSGGVQPNPLSPETQAVLEETLEELEDAAKLAHGSRSNLPKLKKIVVPRVKQLKQHLGDEADQQIVRLVLTFVRSQSLQLGKLTKRERTWEGRNIVRISNLKTNEAEELAFVEINGRTHLFVFRLNTAKEIDLEKTLKTVLLTAHQTSVDPESVPPDREAESHQTLEDASKLAELPAAGGLVLSVLLLLGTVVPASRQAYDICRSRIRLSARESLRIFWKTMSMFVILSFLLFIWRHFLAFNFISLEDVILNWVTPTLLISLLCSTFTVIGARLGFHRSKKMCQQGAALGLLVSLLLARQAIVFLSV